MNFLSVSINEEDDVTAIGAMARNHFGGAVVTHRLVQSGLPEMVRVMLLLLCEANARLEGVHRWVKRQFGVRYSCKRDPLRLFVECSWLLLAYRHDVHPTSVVSDTERFLLRYPQFALVDGEELAKLMWFRNWMAIALHYIRARMNLEHLIALCTALTEGCRVRHVKGSGATPETVRREQIYREEGGVPREPRKPRRERVASSVNVSSLEPVSASELSLPSLHKRCRSVVEDNSHAKRACTEGFTGWQPFGDDLEPASEIEELFDDDVLSAISSVGEEFNDLDSVVNAFMEDPTAFSLF